MIQFNCQGCGRPFSVPPEFAGRSATCKSCGSAVTVPATSSVAPPPTSPAPSHAVASAPAPSPAAAAPKLPMRTRRLMADAKQMADLFARSEVIKVRPVAGDPPEAYHVEYAVRGLERGKGKSAAKPAPREHHLVEIRLTADYPRLAPQCKMLTPVFHPNIDTATICVGDHWTAGERLADLTVRIGEMLAYQAYNIQSPLDAEAAMWADLNQQSLPTDPRPLRPEET